MFSFNIGYRVIKIALLVIDMQNGFVSKGGSYDKLGMNTPNYRKIIPKIKDLINFCREKEIPIFYTEAVREPSGIDLLTNIHFFLPKSREERLKIPICVRGTWDGDTIEELKPLSEDHIVIKRRDSAFQDTELRVWLQSMGINTLAICGIDTSICVETSLRDGFNIGYDIILISDATASGNKQHYETTLERVKDYYGIVMNCNRFKQSIKRFESLSKGEITLTKEEAEKRYEQTIEEFGLLDMRNIHN